MSDMLLALNMDIVESFMQRLFTFHILEILQVVNGDTLLYASLILFYCSR